MTQTITMTVNGQPVTVEVEPRWLLADVLRDQLGLTGTHLDCDHGVCGACTILLDNRPVRACLLLAVQACNHHITTVEGLGDPEHLCIRCSVSVPFSRSTPCSAASAPPAC